MTSDEAELEVLETLLRWRRAGLDLYYTLTVMGSVRRFSFTWERAGAPPDLPGVLVEDDERSRYGEDGKD